MKRSLISHKWCCESEARFAWSASQLEAIEWYPGITICTSPGSENDFGGENYEFGGENYVIIKLHILRLG